MNKFLNALPEPERAQLESLLVPVALRAHQALAKPGPAPRHVYFIDRGLASILATGHGHEAEVAMIGSEGVVNASLCRNARCSLLVRMVTPGIARRIELDALLRIAGAGSKLQVVLQLYLQAQMTAQCQSALAAARGTIPQRLARWLLMAEDRLGAQLFVSQERIAALLGVRRPSVTNAVAQLREAGVVSQLRGQIQILRREELLRLAAPFYTPAASEANQAAAGVNPCEQQDARSVTLVS